MYLGGKTRNKHDHIPSTTRKEMGTKGRRLFRLTDEDRDESQLDVPMLELLDSTPDSGDLIFFGAFNQKLQFDY